MQPYKRVGFQAKVWGSTFLFCTHRLIPPVMQQLNSCMETLQEFNELAYRAFYWTSFSPDKVGKNTIESHEAQLNEDLQNIPEDEKQRYIENYKKLFSAWLRAHSNCASSAVTGGSGFNVRRAEKANNSERARYNEFSEWREKALKAIQKRIENAKPESEKRNENWVRLEKDILHSAAVIHGINKGLERGCSKALFVSSIYQKVETYAKKGDVEIVQQAIDSIRKYNETMSVVITERHKFFKLIELSESKKERKETNSERDNSELTFTGGKIIQNWKEDRIQIVFESKPDRDVIDLLKKNAFKWSPNNTAWQRKNTQNAVYAAQNIQTYLKSK